MGVGATIKMILANICQRPNVNKTDRMTAKEMVSQLQILADEGEIQVEDIPEVPTVANWITWYAADIKKPIYQSLLGLASIGLQISSVTW